MSPSLKSTLAAGLAFLQVAPALAADANGKPYFRFNSCPEGTVCAAPAGSAGSGAKDSSSTGDAQGPPASQVASALAFDSGTFLSDGDVGTPVSGRYVARGGKAPYRMALASAPPGFSLTSLDDTGTAWALSGSMDPAATYANAVVNLTDAANQTVSFPIPLTVNQPATPPQASTFAFSYNTPMPDSPEAAPQYLGFAFDGGTAPYSIAVSGSPLNMTILRSDVGSTNGQVLAAIEKAGTYNDVKLTVTDGANRQISYSFPSFTVTPYSQGDATITVTPVDTPPASMAIGDTYTSNVFTVSGYRPDYGYSVNPIPTGPFGFAVSPVGAPADNQFRITYTATQDTVGAYPGVGLVINSRFDGAVNKIVTLGDMRVVGAPFQIVTQFPASTQVATQTDFAVVGKVRGGSNGYPVTTLTGIPDDANLYLDFNPVDDGMEILLTGSVPADGTLNGIRVTAVDRKTGEKASFTPFGVTAVGAPLSDCTSMPTGPDVLTARSGEDKSLQEAITFKGGTGPYTVTPDVAGSIPAALGFSLDTQYAGTGDVRTVAAYVSPTGVATMSDVAATLRDAKGASCAIRLNAASTGAPDPSQGPMATAQAYNVTDGYNNGAGTAYWDLGGSANGQYFTPKVTVDRMKEIILYGDYCTGCMRILISPPAGKRIAIDGSPFDPQRQQARIRLYSYSSGSPDRRDMVSPLMTRLNDVDGGGYKPGLIVDFARDTPVAGVWLYVFSVEYTDGTAGLTAPLKVEFYGADGPKGN